MPILTTIHSVFGRTKNITFSCAVEKMGVYSLFEKPTGEFDVPLVNIGGWSDVNSRVDMMRRFAYWERRGRNAYCCPLLITIRADYVSSISCARI